MATNFNHSDGKETSGASTSFWVDSTEPIKFSVLDSSQQTDVVVVGGGIAGLTVAYCLCKKGQQVILIEDGYLGSGETGHTTAHIVNALDDFYSNIESHFGENGARLAAESHTAAIDFVEKVVNENNIDCEFRRVDGYMFLHETDKRKTLEDESEATKRAGVPTQLLNEVPGIPSEKSICLHYPRQAQFHPLRYLKGLAEAIMSMGGQIYTETHADKISENGVEANGFFIEAKHVVVATNTPINDIVTIHTKQFPFRSYVIGGLVPRERIKPALWWDSGDQQSKWYTQPYHYVRVADYDDRHYLLISGGEDHKTGQADSEDIPEENRFTALEEWTRKRFPQMENIVYKWSGQVMEPIDHLAFIGRNPGDKNIYIATGDSGNGMTHGTIAGMLISDLITGKQNAWEKIYDPSRLQFDVAGTYLKEAGNMAMQYIDHLTPGDVASASELNPGEGAIIRSGLKKVAVYKDETGKLQAFSAVCPHLGCVVQWNGEEKSFDCPCHGSRFTCSGKVVNGPARTDLKSIAIDDKVEA
jgi:glycine/D-amino acid oxidase-like deaminating enzyme/nitrite reductase/ring-hydroxylating ferredoxin subunit